MTYAGKLTRLWAGAQAPREPGAPTVASLFAGCGGSMLGYLAAGYREVLASEWDEHAAACLRLNFPGCPVRPGDIHDLDPAALGMAPGELDLLDSSPPCQGFSSVGQHRPGDPRNELFREHCRLLAAWQPRAFILENVAGMATDPGFPAIYEALAAPGYKIRAAILPAGMFGAATIRKRLIIVGVRADLGITPTHPAPAARPVPVAQAWRDLPAGTVPLPPPLDARLARLAVMITPGSNGGKALSDRGGRESFYQLVRLAWDRPAPAMWATFRGSDYLQPDRTEYLTIPQMQRIQAFPDQYAWPPGTTYAEAHSRIGNSVCPLLSYHLGKHVRALVPAAVQPDGKGSATRVSAGHG